MRLFAKAAIWILAAGVAYLFLGTVLGTSLRLLFESDPVERVKEQFSSSCGTSSRLDQLECARLACEIALRERGALPREVVAIEWSSHEVRGSTNGTQHTVHFSRDSAQQSVRCEMRNVQVISVGLAISGERK
jgi:hypothetical protein